MSLDKYDAVYTVRGDRFTVADHMIMAALIYDRLGCNVELAAEKWRNMLGNSTTPEEFKQLAYEGQLLMKTSRKLWND